MAIPPSPTVATVKDVAESIIMAQQEGTLGRTIFFIGAGCSVSAGVPAVPAIAQRMVGEIAAKFKVCSPDSDPSTCYFSLLEKDRLTPCFLDSATTLGSGPSSQHIDWYKVYDMCFEKHFRSPDDVRDLFGRILSGCQGAVNWAHLCLGEMAAQHYISTVLTTNFDQLVLSGMASAGLLPVVCDGLESLNRLSSSPAHPQLVELHGSRHTYRLRNRPSEVAFVAGQPGAISSVIGLFNTATTFVAVGYGGREDGVMDLLIDAARTYPDKNLFWVAYSDDLTRIGPKVRDFLSHSTNSAVILGQDADQFFLELCREMGVGSPRAIREPLARFRDVLDNLNKSEIGLSDIKAEVERSHQLLDILDGCERRANEGESSSNVADEIRQMRLKGEYKLAYDRSTKAYDGQDAGNISNAILRERIAAGSQYADELIHDDLASAISIYRGVVDQATEFARRDESSASRILASSLRKLGEAMLRAGEFKDARDNYEAALRLDQQAAEARPNDPDAATALAHSHQALSDLLKRTGDLAGAAANLERALEIRKRLVTDEDDFAARFQLSSIYDRLGDVRRQQGDFVHAQEAFETALSIAEGLLTVSAGGDVQRAMAIGSAKLGDLLRIIGDFDGARSRYLKTLSLTEGLISEFPKTGEYKRDLGIACAKMGDVERDAGRYEEAQSFYIRSLSISRETAATNPRSAVALRDLGLSLSRLAKLSALQEKFDSAREYAEEALAIDEELCRRAGSFSYHKRDLALSSMDLGEINENLGNADSARRYYQSAVELCEEHVKVNPSSADAKRDLSIAIERLADLHEKSGEIASALEHYGRSREIVFKLAAEHPDNPQLARDLEITDATIARLAGLISEG